MDKIHKANDLNNKNEDNKNGGILKRHPIAQNCANTYNTKLILRIPGYQVVL
jgi:hypothetical protein